MTIFLIILLVLSALILFILSLFISVKICYNNREDVFSLYLRILCFNIRILPKKEKKQKKPKKTKEKENDSKTKEKKSQNIFKKVGFFDTVKFISDALSAIFGVLTGVVNNTKIKKLSFILNVAEGDAAKTAITCGYVSAVVYPVLGKILDSVKDYKNYKVLITPDYNESSESSIDVEVIMGIRVFSVLKVLFSKRSELFSVLKTLI